MAEYCDIDWNGYRANRSSSEEYPYMKSPPKVLSEQEALEEIRNLILKRKNAGEFYLQTLLYFQYDTLSPGFLDHAGRIAPDRE